MNRHSNPKGEGLAHAWANSLAAVGRAGRVLVTAKGKPRAIMIPTSEETFSRDLEMLDRVALTRAVEAIRADSVVK